MTDYKNFPSRCDRCKDSFYSKSGVKIHNGNIVAFIDGKGERRVYYVCYACQSTFLSWAYIFNNDDWIIESESHRELMEQELKEYENIDL